MIGKVALKCISIFSTQVYLRIEKERSLYIRSGMDFYTARTNRFQQIISKHSGAVRCIAGGFSFSILYLKGVPNGQAYPAYSHFPHHTFGRVPRSILCDVSGAADWKRQKSAECSVTHKESRFILCIQTNFSKFHDFTQKVLTSTRQSVKL